MPDKQNLYREKLEKFKCEQSKRKREEPTREGDREAFRKSKLTCRSPIKTEQEDPLEMEVILAKLGELSEQINRMNEKFEAIEEMRKEMKELKEESMKFRTNMTERMNQVEIENQKRKEEILEIKEKSMSVSEKKSNEMETLKMKLEKMKNSEERMEKFIRKKNVVVTNWIENDRGRIPHDKILKEINRLFGGVLKIAVDVEEVYLLGVNKKQQTLVLVKLKTWEDKMKIMKTKRCLKDIEKKGVYIDNDMSMEEREKRKKKKEEKQKQMLISREREI